jgi:hypothetical protein
MAALTEDGSVRTTLCDGYTVTIEPTDVGWVVTATDDDDEVLVQFTADDERHAERLYANVANADLSDLM